MRSSDRDTLLGCNCPDSRIRNDGSRLALSSDDLCLLASLNFFLGYDHEDWLEGQVQKCSISMRCVLQSCGLDRCIGVCLVYGATNVCACVHPR